MAAPALPSAEPAPSSDSSRELTPSRLRALILAVLPEAGLQHLKEAMASFLMGTARAMLQEGGVDLAPLWGPLSQDAGITAEQLGRALFLVAFYLTQGLRVPVSIPEEARRAIDDLPAADADEIRQQLERIGHAMAAEAPALEGTSPVPAPPRLAPPGPAPLPMAPVPAPEAPIAAPVLRRRSAVSWSVVAALFLAALAIAGRNIYVLYAGQQQMIRDLQVDIGALSTVVPLLQARISDNALIVSVADPAFNALTQGKQAALGAGLFKKLNRPGISTIHLSCDQARYRIDRRGNMIYVRPMNAERTAAPDGGTPAGSEGPGTPAGSEGPGEPQ